MPSPERFAETLDEFGVDEEIKREIFADFGSVKSSDTKEKKSDYFVHALTVMNEKLPPEQVKEIIMANACCKSGTRLKNSTEFAVKFKHRTLEEKLGYIGKHRPLYMGVPHLDENGDVVVRAVDYINNDRYECACTTISRIDREGSPMPRQYCYCCGGHFKFHYETMLDLKLELAEIVSTPHDGDNKPCVFRFRIIS